MLAHHRRQPPLELAEQIAKPAVAVTVRMALPIFLPQHHQVDAGPLQLAGQRRPIRLGAPAQARSSCRPGRTAAVPARRRSARPARANRARRLAPAANCPGSCCAPPPACGRSRARSPRRGAAATSIVICRMVSSLFAGIPASSLMIEEGSDARVADPQGAAVGPWSACRWWPASPRNGGRLQFGMVAGFKSESRPASLRNTWPECVGICTMHEVRNKESGCATGNVGDHLACTFTRRRPLSCMEKPKPLKQLASPRV